MGHLDIQNKIHNLLDTEVPFKEEKDVVYFLVESRKMLDHIRDGGRTVFPIMRFYCDWALHTNKEHLTPEIIRILEKIASEDKSPDRSSDTLEAFVEMEHLREDILGFAQEQGFPTHAFQNAIFWHDFVHLLCQVLADQPIKIKVASGIKEFRFVPYEGGTAVVYDTIH